LASNRLVRITRPLQAADDVANNATGHHDWDRRTDIGPENLSEWESAG
jgi:hypothetical protein